MRLTTAIICPNGRTIAAVHYDATGSASPPFITPEAINESEANVRRWAAEHGLHVVCQSYRGGRRLAHVRLQGEPVSDAIFRMRLRQFESVYNAGSTAKYDAEANVTTWMVAGHVFGRTIGRIGDSTAYAIHRD